MKYGQFCPIAKATEVLGERWTLLILRELLMGSCRYNQFQRALANISPTLLSKRLKELECAGIIVKKKIQGARSYEYFLTKAGQDLGPIVMSIGKWGMQWAQSQLSDEELDVELLMWDIHRRIDKQYFPGEQGVLKFHFTDVDGHADWWVVINGGDRDLCTEDPGKDVNVYITVGIRTLIDIWGGDKSLAVEQKQSNIVVLGDKPYTRSMRDWFQLSVLAS